MSFIPGWFPTHILASSAPSAPTGLFFNMTAGDFSEAVQGYSDGTQVTAFGSIDVEPIPGNDLSALFTGVSDGISFHGDVTSIVTGLTVWVDGVEYPFDGFDWVYSSGSDLTSGVWNVGGPVFVNTAIYLVEIK